MRTLPSTEVMYDALVRRDESFDGIFIAAVRTTGIFCRPTCPARKPKAENVEYFVDSQSAIEAGYRACLRCRPLEVPGRHPEWVERLLAEVEKGTRLSDERLEAMGVEPTRARRYFRERFGMTFQAYQRAHRMGQALERLNDGDALDRVTYGSGFESSSGFREAFERIFGESPGKARSSRCIVVTMLPSPIGPFVCAANDDGICMLEFADRKIIDSQGETLRRWYDESIVPGTNEHTDQMAIEFEEYYRGERTEFDVALEIAGTPFQCEVWNALLTIPYGETCSYEDIATQIDRPKAQRAVGRANGQNRIAVVIPCHRVVQKGGQLRGYGGGLWRKRFLLDLEHQTAGKDNPESLFASSATPAERACEGSLG